MILSEDYGVDGGARKMMQVTKEELANFSECSVGDIEDAMRMGFKFKTLSDSAYLF